MNVRRLLPTILALSLGACLARPFEPEGAHLLVSLPASYSIWWQVMELCAGITAPLDRVEWYEVPGSQFVTPEGPRWGWWDPPHAIYIAETHLEDRSLVEHEMLHDLLQTGDHPAVFARCSAASEMAAGLPVPGADVQRNDRRAPVQVQHRRIGPDHREVVGEHFDVAALYRRGRHAEDVE